jgi:hypothetical protein
MLCRAIQGPWLASLDLNLNPRPYLIVSPRDRELGYLTIIQVGNPGEASRLSLLKLSRSALRFVPEVEGD